MCKVTIPAWTMINGPNICNDLSINCEIYLIFYVLDSRSGHFGNMQIKKMPPPLLNVITQKWNLQVLRIPKM